MSKPRPLLECRELVGQLSPRMVAISAAFTTSDLSTLGLLQLPTENKTAHQLHHLWPSERFGRWLPPIDRP